MCFAAQVYRAAIQRWKFSIARIMAAQFVMRTIVLHKDRALSHDCLLSFVNFETQNFLRSKQHRASECTFHVMCFLVAARFVSQAFAAFVMANAMT